MKKALLIITLFFTLSFYAQKEYTITVDGKEVKVKDDGLSTQVKTNVATPKNVNVQDGVHIVKKGENLFSISKLHNLTVDELCKMNNFNKDHRLETDESLRVVGLNKPSTNISSALFHIVKKEDTLYNISKRYGLTVDKLKGLNNLDTNIIIIGQRLNVN